MLNIYIYIMYIIRILNSTIDTWSRAWCSRRSMSCTSCSTQCDGFKLFCRVGRARETSRVSDGAGQISELLRGSRVSFQCEGSTLFCTAAGSLHSNLCDGPRAPVEGLLHGGRAWGMVDH